MSARTVRIASRASQLALWQAEYVSTLIQQSSPDITVEIVHVTTTGDANQVDALRQFGGTGVFTREVQQSVLSGKTDIAVHSLKDLQTDPTPGLTLAGIPARAATGDALLLPKAQPADSLNGVAHGAIIGTGSPRRQAQLLSARPDLSVKEIRGNVDTRIRKLDAGEYDAIILAQAGLDRLGLSDRISLKLSPPIMYPAVGQGALGIECREDDDDMQQLLQQLTDACTQAQVTAERSLLATLRAGCHAPLGVSTQVAGDQLTLAAVLLSLDGSKRLEATHTGDTTDAMSVGQLVAEQLIEAGGTELIQTH